MEVPVLGHVDRRAMILLLLAAMAAWNIVDMVDLVTSIDLSSAAGHLGASDEQPPAHDLRLFLRGKPLSSPRDVSTALANASTTTAPMELSPSTPMASVPLSSSVDASWPSPKFSEGAWQRIATIAELNEYECVSFRRTRDCSPAGRRMPRLDMPCHRSLRYQLSGYCEVRHRTTGEIRRVLPIHCNSRFPEARYKCSEFRELYAYNLLALEYKPALSLSAAQCRQALRTENGLTIAADPSAGARAMPLDSEASNDTHEGSQAEAVRELALDFHRAVVFVVYEKIMTSVYASVRWLRRLGCTLPIEIWYLPREMGPSHPLLQALTRHFGAFSRAIHDPDIDTFYTKIYAVYYSAFDQVLLLDADNFAVRDPTYLFDTPEFQRHGALFWPDFWRQNRTIFNMHANSFVWEFFGIPNLDMFEQESGQVVIDRQRHPRALRALLHYGMTKPNVPQQMRLVWGDKDLFRFAWIRTNSTFHMIERPPGAAGLMSTTRMRWHPRETTPAPLDVFCGQTMVQHDTQGQILFFHRNMQKLTMDNRQRVWTHVQQYRADLGHLGAYDVRGVEDHARFPRFRKCYGKHQGFEKAYTVTPMDTLPFADMESQLLALVESADVVLKRGVHTGSQGSNDDVVDEREPLERLHFLVDSSVFGNEDEEDDQVPGTGQGAGRTR